MNHSVAEATAIGASNASASLPSFPLSDVVLHHTWSIRLLSPFVVPLEVEEGGHAELEDDIAAFLENRRRDLGKMDANDDPAWQDEAIITVQMSWGELNAEGDANKNNSKSGSRRQDLDEDRGNGKRRKLDETVKTQQQKHLIIDVLVSEESTEQLVCCYPHHNKGGEINGFDFLLTRGSKSTIEGVLCWMETATKCKTEESSFSPSVADVTRATTLWTSEHWHGTHHRGKGAKPKGNSDDNSPTNSIEVGATKPLTLTYQVPLGSVQNAGLETISLTVPPVALMRLCNDLLAFRKDANKDKIRNNRAIERQKGHSIAIVKALQCFLRETFCIHIDKFALIRATCSVAVLGCDGRCKPTSPSLLSLFLSEIQSMILHRDSETMDE